LHLDQLVINQMVGCATECDRNQINLRVGSATKRDRIQINAMMHCPPYICSLGGQCQQMRSQSN
ncbi:MAG: hypothetical protein F6K10_14390, partial [Moorea sp. SIO2B7]|nr:hypothetical protein [Moorena sp. SIO2B7]